MSNDTLKAVQDQHAAYSKMLGEKQSYLSQVKDQIKRLRAEFKTALSHVAELTGAVNMGSQVIEKMQADTPVAPAVTSTPTDPIVPSTVEGEVVK